MAKEIHTKDKGGHHMAVSMAVVPLLKDDVAKSFMDSLKSAKLKAYSDEQRKNTDKMIEEVFRRKQNK